MPRRIITPLGRFFEKVETRAPDRCWRWTGAVNADGYPRFSVGDRVVVYAHRWIYEQMVGPIPDGFTIEHECRSPSCVNWRHLSAMSLRDNILSSPTSLASKNRAKTHCVNGHPYSAENTYRPPSQPNIRVCRACRNERQAQRRKGA